MRIKKTSEERLRFRQVVKEELLKEVADGADAALASSGASKAAQGAASKKKLEIKSIGDLKKAIKMATLKKRGKLAAGGAKDAAAGMFIDMVPFGGLVKDLGAAALAAYKLPDGAQTKTGLDALNVDDNVSKIVADEVENAFLKTMGKKLKGLPDETPLAQVNMTQMLSQFIASKFNKATVVAPKNEAKNKDGKEQGADGKACWDGYRHAGTEDGKDKCVKAEGITRSQLREIVMQELNDITEGGKCDGPTEKASSDAKGKKWQKCVKNPDGKGYVRKHWGQAGVRVKPKTKGKSFRARHGCSDAKAGTPKALACADWPAKDSK